MFPRTSTIEERPAYQAQRRRRGPGAAGARASFFLMHPTSSLPNLPLPPSPDQFLAQSSFPSPPPSPQLIQSSSQPSPSLAVSSAPSSSSTSISEPAAVQPRRASQKPEQQQTARRPRFILYKSRASEPVLSLPSSSSSPPSSPNPSSSKRLGWWRRSSSSTSVSSEAN
ncbi:hypothetical protein T439DRAFT_217689 [Meredithblackwellia eburnea MCA 4105]